MSEAEYLTESNSGNAIGLPFTKIQTVHAMRCYTSSMACLVGGGIYGLIRTPAKLIIDPLLVYSITGVGKSCLTILIIIIQDVTLHVGGPRLMPMHYLLVGAMVLNMLYGTYGLRNWLKRRTYIEDEATHLAYTWSQVILGRSGQVN